ncbi:5868_t:CDS:2 [Cetraspora pellucida]|uniref:COX assembly mitochondrial protein n=1 Tax=Cetraspora pellucida TaxID=1433469 RepID=A0A9N9BUH9_9GLOM|nr:5868_t:CDS:2 [Cetraspora pellucida]
MHPNLAYHEHPSCVDIIRRLEECHQSGFFKKYFGGCNGIKLELNECLTAEYQIKRLKNAEEAKKRRQRVEAMWKEIDEMKKNL